MRSTRPAPPHAGSGGAQRESPTYLLLYDFASSPRWNHKRRSELMFREDGNGLHKLGFAQDLTRCADLGTRGSLANPWDSPESNTPIPGPRRIGSEW